MHPPILHWRTNEIEVDSFIFIGCFAKEHHFFNWWHKCSLYIIITKGNGEIDQNSITDMKITCIHIPYKSLILTDNCPQNRIKKKKKTTTTTKYALQINAKCMFFPNDLLGNLFYVDHRLTQFNNKIYKTLDKFIVHWKSIQILLKSTNSFTDSNQKKKKSKYSTLFFFRENIEGEKRETVREERKEKI